MKRTWLLVLMFIFLSSGSVLAAEAKPIVKQANIEVSPKQDGVEVSEQITLANVEAVKEGKIQHIITQFENTKVENLIIKAGEKELTVEAQEGKLIDKLLIPVPEGVTGDFTYSISFRYSGSSDLSKIPLVVPAIASDGMGNIVSLKINIPEGMYLHDSFPIFDSGNTGSVTEYMINIPNFVSIQLGSSPAGFFTSSNMYSLFGLIVILGFIAAWLLNEKKGKQGVATNV
jgi:hypothetical protein